MNIGIIIIIALAGLWALGIFFGVIGGVSKTFNHDSVTIDSSEVKSQEQKTIDDTEAKRQKLMDDMKPKMEDAGHHY